MGRQGAASYGWAATWAVTASPSDALLQLLQEQLIVLIRCLQSCTTAEGLSRPLHVLVKCVAGQRGQQTSHTHGSCQALTACDTVPTQAVERVFTQLVYHRHLLCLTGIYLTNSPTRARYGLRRACKSTFQLQILPKGRAGART